MVGDLISQQGFPIKNVPSTIKFKSRETIARNISNNTKQKGSPFFRSESTFFLISSHWF